MPLYISIGVSGSSKISHAFTLNVNTIISRDHIYEVFRNQGLSVRKPIDLCHKSIIYRIQSSTDDCYYDSTNLTPDIRLFFVNLAQESGLKVVYVIFNIHPDILKQRVVNHSDHPTQEWKTNAEKFAIEPLGGSRPLGHIKPSVSTHQIYIPPT